MSNLQPNITKTDEMGLRIYLILGGQTRSMHGNSLKSLKAVL